jgi:ABC-2 type transport system permease protein
MVQSYLKLVVAQAKLFLREPLALFFTIGFPVLLLLFWGAAFGNGNAPLPGTEFGFIDVQLPALAGMILGTIALNALPSMTANNRERGIFRRFKATPMPAWQWMAAEITTNFIVALISMVLLVVVGRVVLAAHMPPNLGAVLAGFTLAALSFMAFGYLVASLAPTPRSAVAAGQLLFVPMFLLSGASMPLNLFPESVQLVAQWMPMTHVVTLMQTLWLAGEWPMTSVWVLVGMGAVCSVLAARLFQWE